MLKIKNLKAGMSIWECEYGINIPLLVLEDAVENTDSQGTFWICKVQNIRHGSKMNLMVREGYEHYGPKLYDEPAYFDGNEEYEQ